MTSFIVIKDQTKILRFLFRIIFKMDSDTSSQNVRNMLTTLASQIEKISDVMDTTMSVNYNELSTENKIRHDLFLAYSLSSLMWLLMRMNGEDPSQTVLKTELNRVKENMSDLQREIDRKTIMPKLDQGAAKRFINHSLWEDQNTKKARHLHFDK